MHPSPRSLPDAKLEYTDTLDTSDGKDDYAFIDEDGGIHLWYNRGHGDTSLLIDNIHFADLYGEGVSIFRYLQFISSGCSNTLDYS